MSNPMKHFNTDTLAKYALRIYLTKLKRNGSASAELSVRAAAQILREAKRRDDMTDEQAEYYDGVTERDRRGSKDARGPRKVQN